MYTIFVHRFQEFIYGRIQFFFYRVYDNTIFSNFKINNLKKSMVNRVVKYNKDKK